MNFYSKGLELTSREGMRTIPPNDIPGRQVMDEASRKRKASDSNFLNNFCNDASTRYLANSSDSFEHLLHGESTSQHNVLPTDSQQKTVKVSSNYYSHSANPTNESSQNGDFQFYGTHSSVVSTQSGDGNFQESTVDGSHDKELPLLSGTPVGTLPNFPLSQNREHDIGRHAEASKVLSCYNQNTDWAQADFRSNGHMKSVLRNNNMPNIIHPANMLSSRDLTFLGPPQTRMTNGVYGKDVGSYAQDLGESGLLEVKSTGENMEHAEDNNLAVHTTTFGPTSVDDKRAHYASYQHADTGIRSLSNPCNSSSHSRLKLRDGYSLQLPVVAETSDHEAACPENGMSKSTTLISDPGTKAVVKDDRSNGGTECHSLGVGPLPKVDNSSSVKLTALGNGLPSIALDNQRKPAAASKLPVIIDKLWDGLLQLNLSVTVSAIAIYKSGEKAPENSWPQDIEIKGKVRLQAFEKFIEELPRSRNRALMVISLCWKTESSAAGLTGMKEVAKNYRETKRVGFGHIRPGYDLYLCPRSYTIITILAKHGFFKGTTAIEEDQDSFIGCVVWRKGPSLNPAHQKQDNETTTLQKQAVNSADTAISNQTTCCPVESDGIVNKSVPDTRSNSLEKSTHMTTSGKQARRVQETAPTYTDSIRSCMVQHSGSNSLQESMKNVQIHAIKILEPRGSDLSYESAQVVIPGPSPIPQVTRQSSRQPSQDSHFGPSHAGPAPLLNSSVPFNSLLKPAEPLARQLSNFKYQEEPTKLGIPASKELILPEMGFDPSRPMLPGSAQLLPEILQKFLGPSKAVHGTIVKGTEACETVAGLRSTEHILARAPAPLPQAERSPGSDEGDDLPEFDFGSTRGVLEVPVRSFPWTGHNYRLPEASQIQNQLPDVSQNTECVPPGMPMSKPTEVLPGPPASSFMEKPYHFSELPQRNNQLPNAAKTIDGHLPQALPVTKPTQVMQRSMTSSFPEKSFNSYPATSLPTKFREFEFKGELKYQASQFISRTLSMNVEAISASPRDNDNFPRKKHWDDEDDMPEWCPPPLDHLDHAEQNSILRQPSPVLKSTVDTVQQSPFATKALPSFQLPQNQGNNNGYQTGLLGRLLSQGYHPGLPGPYCTYPSTAASAQTRQVAEFSHSGMRLPSPPSQNQGIHHGYQHGMLGLPDTYPAPAASTQTRAVTGFNKSGSRLPSPPSQSQGIHHGHQPGILGEQDTCPGPAASVQTNPIAGLNQSGMRLPSPQSQNQGIQHGYQPGKLGPQDTYHGPAAAVKPRPVIFDQSGTRLPSPHNQNQGIHQGYAPGLFGPQDTYPGPAVDAQTRPVTGFDQSGSRLPSPPCQNQGIHHGYQPGMLGPQDTYSRPPVSAQTRPEFDQSGTRLPSPLSQNQGIHHGYQHGMLGEQNTYSGLAETAQTRPVTGWDQSGLRHPSPPSQNQGIHRGYQTRMLGPQDTFPGPVASAQTRPLAGFGQSDLWNSSAASQNQFSRPLVAKFDNKPPADFNRR